MLTNQNTPCQGAPNDQTIVLAPETIRVSIEVPNTPRFILSFLKEHFQTVKQFILFVCQQTGLNDKEKYLLMLEDAVIVNIDSIRDNDRLNVVVASSIIGDNPKPPKPSYAPIVPPTQMADGGVTYNGTPLLPRISL